MRLTLIQMNSRTAARDENVERACSFIDQAAEAGSDFVVLPEFFNTEYFPQYRDSRYMDYAEAEDGYTQSRIKERARRHGLYVGSGRAPLFSSGTSFESHSRLTRDVE